MLFVFIYLDEEKIKNKKIKDVSKYKIEQYSLCSLISI